jgi:hypothetical protein
MSAVPGGRLAATGGATRDPLEERTMAKDAAAALGAAEVAGTLVSPKGLTKKMTARTAGGQVGGLVGTLAATAMTGRADKVAPDVPSFGRIGYLAASETELVLTKTSQLGWKPHPTGDALVRVPRSEVESVAMEQGKLLSQLTLTFAGGVTWAFEVPRANRKGAADFVTKLGGNVS